MTTPTRVTIEDRNGDTWIIIRESSFRSPVGQVLFVIAGVMCLLIALAAVALGLWYIVAKWPVSVLTILFVAFLCVVLFLGVIGIFRQISGTDELVIQDGKLWRRVRRVIAFQFSKWPLPSIRNLRYVPENKAKTRSANRMRVAIPSFIAFDAGAGQPVKFGRGLEQDEAAPVIRTIESAIAEARA